MGGGAFSRQACGEKDRPGAQAVHGGHRVVLIQEFTRPNDWAGDWQSKTDAHKEERYAPLRDKLAGAPARVEGGDRLLLLGHARLVQREHGQVA